MVIVLFGFEANVPQTESSLQGIMLMMSLLPACATFISMLFILKYPLTEKKMNEIVKKFDAKERRSLIYAKIYKGCISLFFYIHVMWL